MAINIPDGELMEQIHGLATLESISHAEALALAVRERYDRLLREGGRVPQASDFLYDPVTGLPRED